jgi:menaquinone-specific isochorismate synthase
LSPRTTLIADPGDLSAYLTRSDVTACWLRRGAGFVGLGEAWHESFASAEEAGAWWQDLARTLNSGGLLAGAPSSMGPVAFVSFPFDPGHTSARCEVVVPHTIVGRRDETGWITSWGPVPDGLGRPAPPPAGPGPVTFGPGPLDPSGWQRAVGEALQAIQAGTVEKVVLARAESATAENPVALPWLLQRLQARDPQTWTFAVAGLVGATPE